MDTLTKYQLMNRALEEKRANTDALRSICSIMSFAGSNPVEFDLKAYCPENISFGRWAAMVNRTWKEHYGNAT